jgi:hypothetical protein
MKKIMPPLSLAALALTLLPAVFVFLGRMSWSTHAQLMLVGTALWFVTAPWWMRERKE